MYLRSIAAAVVLGCLGCEVAHEQQPLEPIVRWRHSESSSLDLLLMIDNSGTMVEEQASLSEQLPRLFRVLATGDTNGDGIADFRPPTSVHVGAVSSDMGTGGFRVPSCVEPNFGDDGILRTEGNTSISGCMATYPPFLELTTDAGDPAAIAADVGCVAHMGAGGCGFEQQLDAVLKAVTPSTSPIRFVRESAGHGDGTNAGFLREDSTLAVVLLSDEEDCSALDPAIFDPMSAAYTGDFNLRCFMYPGAVHPVQRYADGLLALRPGREEQLVFAAIVGAPDEIVAREGDNFEEILAAPAMQERTDETAPTPRLVPSCNVPGRGIAFPPRRIVQVAQQIEARGGVALVQSICQLDYTPAINLLLSRLADRFREPHICGDLPLAEDGSASCWVEVDGVHLDQLAVREGIPEAGEGWYREPSSVACRGHDRVVFTEHALPRRAELALFCPTYVRAEEM